MRTHAVSVEDDSLTFVFRSSWRVRLSVYGRHLLRKWPLLAFAIALGVGVVIWIQATLPNEPGFRLFSFVPLGVFVLILGAGAVRVLVARPPTRTVVFEPDLILMRVEGQQHKKLGWDWILEAYESEHGLDLKAADERLAMLVFPRAAISDKKYARLRELVVRNVRNRAGTLD